jgi:hypothetical protein
MKKAKQVPLEMPLEELRSYALNIEETKVNEVKNSRSTETKEISNNHPPSQKNRKRNGKGKFNKGKRNGQRYHTSSILDGQAKLVCSFCVNIGHVENTCRPKEGEMKDEKQFTKYKSQNWKKDKLEKGQSYATETAKAAYASASKQNDSDDEKFDKHDIINAFIKSYAKSQNKAAGKCKRKRSDSYTDSSDSYSNYSNSYQIVALKLKRSKIGVPTTEVIGETNVKDKKIHLRIIIDTCSSSSIILKRFINKNALVKDKKTTNEWTTLGGKLYTNEQGTVKFKLPEFFLKKTIEFKLHVEETTVSNDSYAMIIGRDLITGLKLVLDVDTQCIAWDGIYQPMKIQGK